MEENKNEAIEETMNDVEVIDLYPEAEEEISESSGIGKFVVVGLAVAGAGLAALAVKNKDKIKEKRLAKMKKKLQDAGFFGALAIEDPVEVVEADEEDFLEEEVETNDEA